MVTGNFSISETNFNACSLSVNTTYLVVGIFNFSISCLVKYLLDSILVADFVGPKSLKSFLLNSSFIPSANTSAGPTIVKSIFSFIAKSLIFSISYISISTLVAPSILQFPCKTYILSTNLLFLQAFNIACSRPPFPIISIFIKSPLFY